MHDSPAGNGPPSDSPWLWIAIFGVGALLALTLSAPKYAWRQPQIEREYQARERAGQAVSAAEGPQPLIEDAPALIRLEPLMMLIASLLFFASLAFWRNRLKSARRKTNSS